MKVINGISLSSALASCGNKNMQRLAMGAKAHASTGLLRSSLRKWRKDRGRLRGGSRYREAMPIGRAHTAPMAQRGSMSKKNSHGEKLAGEPCRPTGKSRPISYEKPAPSYPKTTQPLTPPNALLPPICKNHPISKRPRTFWSVVLKTNSPSES